MLLVEDDLERLWRYVENERMEYYKSVAFNIYIYISGFNYIFYER